MNNKQIRFLTLLLLALLALTACGGGQTAVTHTPAAVMPTPRPPVTLAPTFTPMSTQLPLPTITPPAPRDTAVPNTPIPFDETVLELRYQIPLLGLDRRLQANVANQIIVVDEANGRSIQRNNEGSVMFELRQAIAALELAAMPEDCPGCVFVDYELSDAGLRGSGWLQDPVFLASVENFMSATLGPHFPEGTVIGLRRSASPYAPGHSAAVLADGRVWTWLATDAEIGPPLDAEAGSQLLAGLTAVPLDELADSYTADCRGTPLETLRLTNEEETWSGRIVCPELSLPTTLLPLYTRLDDLLAAETAAVTLPQPDPRFPLNGLLVYNTPGDRRLTLFADGTIIGSRSGEVFTGTLATTAPISLTTSLLDTGLLRPGFATFDLDETPPISGTVTPEPAVFTLAVRGPDGVLDGEWAALPDQPSFALLEEILQALLPDVLPDAAETAVPETETTPSPSPTPGL